MRQAASCAMNLLKKCSHLQSTAPGLRAASTLCQGVNVHGFPYSPQTEDVKDTVVA